MANDCAGRFLDETLSNSIQFVSASLPQLLEKNTISEMLNNNLGEKCNASSTTLCSSVHAGRKFNNLISQRTV